MKRLFVIGVLLLGLTACASDGTRNKPHKASKQEQLVDINLKLGMGYMRSGNNRQALDKLQRALEYDNSHPVVNATIALLYGQLREDELAEKYYRRALALDADNEVTHANFGSFLCNKRRYEEAIDHYREAWENKRNRTPELAYASAGICLNKSGDRAQAETYMRKALEFNPKYPLALMQMAELSHAANNHLRTRAYLQRLTALAPLGSRALLLGVRTEQHLGDRDMANHYRDQLIKRYPDSEEARTLRRGIDDGVGRGESGS